MKRFLSLFLLFLLSILPWLSITPVAYAAALTATNVEPASLLAGATSTVTVSFTTVGAIPLDGKIKVTFGAGFNVVGAAGGTCATMNGVFATSVAGQVVTITRSGGALEAAAPETCTINTIINPTAAGSTGTYTIRTTTAADAEIDVDAAVAADTITPNALTATNVEPATLVASNLTTVTISFTTFNSVLNNDKIKVTFGAGFNVAGATGGTCATMDGGFATAVAGQVVTITRNAAGTTQAPAAETCTVNSIINPAATGTTGTYSIQTTTNADAVRDQDLAVAADTISGGSRRRVICGDGFIQSGEQCDDNNTVSGDGCSDLCQIETVTTTTTPITPLTTTPSSTFFPGSIIQPPPSTTTTSTAASSEIITTELLRLKLDVSAEFPEVNLESTRSDLNTVNSALGTNFRTVVTVVSPGVVASQDGSVLLVVNHPNLFTSPDANKIPGFQVSRSSDKLGDKITIDFDSSLTFARPVMIVMKLDLKTAVEITDENGQPITSFLYLNGRLLVKTNVLRDFTVRVLDQPKVVTLFADAEGDAEAEAILELRKRGIFSGFSDGTFRPGEYLKRAQTAKVVSLSAGIEADAELKGDLWYSAQKRALDSAQVTKGTISPETLENRVNFLSLIAKAKGVNINTLPACGAKPFDDVATSAWYCPVVKYAVEQGWLTETKGKFNPSGLVTRSAAAGLIFRSSFQGD